MRQLSTLAVRGFGSMGQFGLAVLVGRTLGPAGTGVYQTFANWVPWFAAFLGQGMPIGALRAYATSEGASRGEGRASVLGRATRRIAGATLVVSLIVMPVLAPTSRGRLVLLASIGGGAVALVRVGTEALKGLSRTELGVIVEFAAVPAMVAVLIGIAFVAGFVPDSTDVIQAQIAFTAVLAAVVVGLLYRNGPRIEARRLGVGAWPSDLRRFWLIALINAAYGALPYAVLPFVATSDEIGQFSAAHKLVALTSTATTALASVYAPHFAVSSVQDRGRMRSVYLEALRWNLMINAPLLLVLLVLPGPAMSLFGTGFERGAHILIVMAALRSVAAACGLGEMFLSMTGGARMESLSAILSLVIFGVMVTLPGGQNVTGIATAFGGAFATRALLSLAFSVYHLRGWP